MLPLLRQLADGQVKKLSDLHDPIAGALSVSAGDRKVLLASGSPVFANRLAWAKLYLKRALLLSNDKRGFVQITLRGQEVLAELPARIDQAFLRRFPEFEAFVNPKDGVEEQPTELASLVEDVSPAERMDVAYTEYQRLLASEVLEQTLAVEPRFFEQLVVDLLVAMGYGGNRVDAGRAIGRSGDGGIDGIIKEDKLGLDLICVQAKRWQGSVGRPAVQAFAGSMEAHRARKGVMLTTGTFTEDAYDYIERIERKIILIDGRRLAQLMIEHGVGVAVSRVYAIKRIDSDYFVDDNETY